MRAGYDRVYADMRRPMIPDMPLPIKRQPEDIPDDSGKALAVVLAVFVFLLFFAVATGFYASHTRPAVSETASFSCTLSGTVAAGSLVTSNWAWEGERK